VVLCADHAAKLGSLYADLSTRLSAAGAASCMYQHGALTLRELQSIQCLRDRPVEAAETLLNIVIEQTDRAVYDSFLDALRHSSQQHVYQWIVYDCYNAGTRSQLLVTRPPLILFRALRIRVGGVAQW